MRTVKLSPLAVIFLVVLLDMLSYGMVIPLLPFYVQNYAGGAILVGSLGSLYALMQLGSGPILGALSDRYGRRPLILACLAGTMLAFLLLGLANSLFMVILAVLLDGITGGNLTTAYAYIADITSPAERSRGMGLVGAAFGLGLIAGPALGGWLSAANLTLPAVTAAITAAVNILVGLFLLKESLPPEKRSAQISWRTVNSLEQLLRLFQAAPLRLLLITVFSLNLAFNGLQNNFPLFSQARFGWDGVRNGLLFAFVGICAVLVQGVIFRWLQPRLGEKKLAAGGLALMALGLAGVAAAARDWVLFPMIALVTLGSGVSIPSLTGLLSTRVDSGSQGKLMGGMQSLLSLAMIIGPSAAGIAFDQITAAAPYWLGSLLSALALVTAVIAIYGAQRGFSGEISLAESEAAREESAG